MYRSKVQPSAGGTNAEQTSAVSDWPFCQRFLPSSQPSHCHGRPALGPFMCTHVTNIWGGLFLPYTGCCETSHPHQPWFLSTTHTHTHTTLWTHSWCWEQWCALFQSTSCHQTPGLKPYYMMSEGGDTLIASSLSQSRLGYGQGLWYAKTVLRHCLYWCGVWNFKVFFLLKLCAKLSCKPEPRFTCCVQANRWINKSEKQNCTEDHTVVSFPLSLLTQNEIFFDPNKVRIPLWTINNIYISTKYCIVHYILNIIHSIVFYASTLQVCQSKQVWLWMAPLLFCLASISTSAWLTLLYRSVDGRLQSIARMSRIWTSTLIHKPVDLISL